YLASQPHAPTKVYALSLHDALPILTLGGGCEMTMHADRVVAAAETYIGLVETGVGVIPGGGGTKEMTLRTSREFEKDDVKTNRLDRKSTRLNSSHVKISYAVFCLKK